MISWCSNSPHKQHTTRWDACWQRDSDNTYLPSITTSAHNVHRCMLVWLFLLEESIDASSLLTVWITLLSSVGGGQSIVLSIYIYARKKKNSKETKWFWEWYTWTRKRNPTDHEVFTTGCPPAFPYQTTPVIFSHNPSLCLPMSQHVCEQPNYYWQTPQILFPELDY